MKQSEARKHLRLMMVGLQRFRSIVKEGLGPDSGELHLTDKFAAEMWPWVFGEKCPLPALCKMVDAKEIAPVDYYNMMFLLERFMPDVKMAINILMADESLPDGPPSIQMLRHGWEEETE